MGDQTNPEKLPTLGIVRRCCCCPNYQRRQQLCDRRRRELKKRNSELKLLVLGTGEAGKSTFIKQIRIIHGQSYSEHERRSFRPQVYQAIFLSIESLIQAMELLGIGYGDPENVENADLINGIPCKWSVTSLVEPFVSAIRCLWNDRGVQECYGRRREYHISDSAKYYLSDLDRFAEKDYLPNLQDILRIRIPTTGIHEYSFEIDKMIFWLIDVGGQRGERRKWIHVFEHVNTYIIFLVATSEYDQCLFEAANENRMQESLCLFKSIVGSPFFANTTTILFLNKSDILAEKIMTSRLADYCPEYKGPEKDVEAAQEFFKDLFVNAVPSRKHNVYPHITCATDTENIAFVFSVVKKRILELHLEQTGLL